MPINWLASLLQAQRIASTVRSRRERVAPPLPIIYLPGILGVKLFDRRNQAYIWGDYRGTLFRKEEHAGYALGDDHDVVATEVMHYFRIIPGLLDSLITAELKHVLEQALGYREGRDLFFLGYDWRQDYHFVAERVERKIAEIRSEYGPTQQVILLGQSAANLAVRHLMRSGSAQTRDSVAKWYCFGPVWQGTYNSLKMLREGYYPAGRRFHGFSPEDSFTYPGCYQLLPRDARMVTKSGAPVSDFDIYNADCWADYGLGPASLQTDWQDKRPVLAGHLARAKELGAALDGSDPREEQVPQTWFAGARNQALTAAVKHPGGALVSEAGVYKHAPQLASQVLEVGDDHIPLRHLTQRPCGPLVSSYDSIPYGENYVLIGRPKDHRAIINYQPNLAALAEDIAEVNANA